MNLTPFLQSGWVIQLHTGAALIGVLLGALQFAMKKGTRLHRIFGWTWMTLLGITAFGSFFINEIRLVGPFSPIHLLSIFTLSTIFESLKAIKAGNVANTNRTPILTYPYEISLPPLPLN